VLGANLLHGLDATFDAEGARFAWAPANCTGAHAAPRTVPAAQAAADNARAGVLAPGAGAGSAREAEAARPLLLGALAGVLVAALLVAAAALRRRLGLAPRSARGGGGGGGGGGARALRG